MSRIFASSDRASVSRCSQNEGMERGEYHFDHASTRALVSRT